MSGMPPVIVTLGPPTNGDCVHYYKRNIGDYAKKAGRLTMLQHGAYTMLMDACYDREIFPTIEEAIAWTWASTEAEIAAVKLVLSRFFTLDNSGKYIQPRILEELLLYHQKSDKNRSIAIERETKRAENRTKRAPDVDETCTKRAETDTKRAPEVHEWSPNHKPLTINQQPTTRERRATRLPADWQPDSELMAWATNERPDLNIGKTLESFRDHWKAAPGKSGTKMDWPATFRNWVRKERKAFQATPLAKTFAERDRDAKRAAWEARTGQKWPDDQPYTLDGIVTVVTTGENHVAAIKGH